MKTPDEIKKGLECCADYGSCSVQGCPYNPIKDCGHDLYSDALAYIQRLERERDALIDALEDNKFKYETGFVRGFEAAQPKWISVEEGLPEFEKLVLVAVNGKWKNFTFVNALQMATLYKEDGWIIEGFEEWDKPEVTHWMPAPEMP